MADPIPVCATSDRAAWLEARRSGIGSSDAAAIVGASPWATPLDVWARKRGLVADDELADSEPVHWGVVLEDVVRAQYASARYAGRPSERSTHMLRSSRHGWALATLDAWTYIDGQRAPLEIKTAHGARADDWANGPPEHYRWQIQHQLLVTGCGIASIACLLGGQRLVWCDVPRDETMIGRLIAAGGDMWRRVQTGDPPPATGRDSRSLSQIYREDHTLEPVVLDGSLISVVREALAARAARDAAQRIVDDREATLKQAIGTARGGVLADGTVVSWTTVRKKESIVRATEYRTLRIKTPKEKT